MNFVKTKNASIVSVLILGVLTPRSGDMVELNPFTLIAKIGDLIQFAPMIKWMPPIRKNTMNASTSSNGVLSRTSQKSMNTSTDPARQERAFTLTDLLVLIATLTLLATVVLPAFASVQNKGGRLQCADNLRQIGMESMIYASDYKGVLPICTLGAANEGNKFDYLGGVDYTYFVVDGATVPSDTPVSTNGPAFLGSFQNLGFLFQAGLAGNGSIFYCPSQWGDPSLGANAYTPLLTTDSTGTIRSSYFYNPRIVSSGLIGEPAFNELRRYQKTSQLEPHRLFAMDSLLQTGATMGVNLASIQHARERGWNVLFTDGSVEFSRLTETNNADFNLILQRLVSNESETSFQEYDEVFTFLEQDIDLGQ